MTSSAGKFLSSLLGQFVSVLVVLLLVLLGLFLVFEHHERESHQRMLALSNDAIRALAREDLLARGQRLASQLAASVAMPMQLGDAPRIADLARATLQQPDVQYVIVFDAEGRIVDAGDGSNHVGQPMVDPLADAALQAGALKSQWSNNLLDVAMPVRAAGQRVGGVRVGLAATRPGAQARILTPITGELQEAMQHQQFWALAMLLLVSVLGAGIVLLLEWRVLGPVRRLGRIMSEDKPGHLAPLEESTRVDEIGDLMRAFTRMRESRFDSGQRVLLGVDVVAGGAGLGNEHGTAAIGREPHAVAHRGFGLAFKLSREPQHLAGGIARQNFSQQGVGGLAVALAECCISGPDARWGAMVQLSLDGLRRDAVLFGESQSRILLSVKQDQEERVLTLAKEADVPAAKIGTVGGNRLVVRVDGDQRTTGCTVDLELTTLYEQWARAIPRALGQD